MAQFKQLEPGFSVAGQITVEDVERAAALGFRAIVCNRPDGEDKAQPSAGEISAAAQKLGLLWRHMPVRGYDVNDEDVVDGFVELVECLDGPVLFYCRSGNRCTLLWAQYAAPRIGVDRAEAPPSPNRH